MSVVSQQEVERQEPDVVWGAAAIGAVINRTERQAFYLLESSNLPAKKIGGLWCASRAKLLEAIST